MHSTSHVASIYVGTTCSILFHSIKVECWFLYDGYLSKRNLTISYAHIDFSFEAHTVEMESICLGPRKILILEIEFAGKISSSRLPSTVILP